MERGNLRKQEVGGCSRVHQRPGRKETQDSKGGTLDEMPDSRERELMKPISSVKTRHQMWEGVVKILT